MTKIMRARRVPNSRGSLILVSLMLLSTVSLLVSSSFERSVNAVSPIFTNGQAAAIVIGQDDFGDSGSGHNASQLHDPYASAFDSSGNLWIADDANNRILKYAPPFSIHEAATLSIGSANPSVAGPATVNASDLSSPTDLAFDSSGNLWVSDSGNCRVLEFAKPFSNHESASVAIGVASTSSTCGAFPTQKLMGTVLGIAFDPSGNLWVGDASDSRILEFTTPFSSDQSASKVIGCSTYTASCPATCTASTMFQNAYVAFDTSGDLWSSEAECSRVVEFPAPLSTGMSATLVLGQDSLTADNNNLNASGMYNPELISFDSSGNIWVVDSYYTRVMQYLTPFKTHEAATLVIGQTGFTSMSSGTTSTTLDAPSGVAFDSTGNLWVSDFGNNRQLEYAGLVPVSVTIVTSPANLPNALTVDGTTYATNPGTFSWYPGTTQSLSALSYIFGSGFALYHFSSWSQGGSQSQTYTVTTATTTTLTASYATQANQTGCATLSHSPYAQLQPSCVASAVYFAWYDIFGPFIIAFVAFIMALGSFLATENIGVGIISYEMVCIVAGALLPTSPTNFAVVGTLMIAGLIAGTVMQATRSNKGG